MAAPKILVFAGSLRTGSYNVRLAALAAKELALADSEVTRISLEDFPLPLYDANLEARSGPPDIAVKLKQMMSAHQGVFIATPEYNASITPLLKNTLDWISRVRERGEPPLAAYNNRAFALGAASPGRYGGMRSILALRQVLEIGCGALVIPEFVSVANAAEAFDEMDNFKDERTTGQLREVARRLVEIARLIG
jgi:chromate reductase, NAD(P)H dehydrogenase (quinone)